jgi:hypothetical protein
MDKQSIRESILRTVTQEIDGWLEEEPGISDPIEYETRLLKRTLSIGRTILERSRGEVSRDRNKKKHFDDSGEGSS